MKGKVKRIGFNVDAYTARLIGRENVSKLEGAILEIVKNAYDADAKAVCIYYSNERQCVYIMDNGTGMTEDIIRTHWMTIGNSSKKETYVTKGKRIQTGAKGIGRFALDRIADRCHMLTVSDMGGVEWVVDWNDFNRKKRISDVKARISESDSSLTEYANIDKWKNSSLAAIVRRLEFDGNGTVFVLEGLHDVWDDKTVQRLRRHLENLLPPDVVHDFRIFFFCDTTAELAAEVVSSNLGDCDYRISFKVNGNTLKIGLLRNEFDFQGEEDRVFKEAGFDETERPYFHGTEKCTEYGFDEIGEDKNWIGDFKGVLYFNKIAATKVDIKKFYYKDISARRNLTKDFGGIKLYRDHFRVRPYGEYGDNDFDWLELSARRNRSPAGLGHESGKWCVGAEQMVGIIEISRKNTNLEDAANRNGIQEGKGFRQLKNIILRVILEFERDRQAVGRKLAAYAKKKNGLQRERERIEELAAARRQWEAEQKQQKGSSENLSEKLAKDKTSAFGGAEEKEVPSELSVNPEEVSDLLKSMDERQEQELQELRDEIKMLQTLATTGIITNMFMHEIRTLTTNIGLELDSAYDAIKYDDDVESAFKNIQQAITFKKNFASWFGVTIESIKKDKRQRKRHNIAEMLTPFIDTWKNILEKNHVDMFFSCDGDIELKCFEFDVENIISNLIANSLASFERENCEILEKKEIAISIRKEENGCVLSYEDTGWGLAPKYKTHPELILEPFESSRSMEENEEGTGMGMWIVNRTVLEYNGAVDLEENKKRDMGFIIKMSFGGNYV